jgi:voltage-gated potassium channel Kch
VISLLLAFRGLARAVIAVWRDPDTKALPVVAGSLILTGTIVYWRFEDWSFIQSLYFSVVTLTTVGYGDLTPTSDGTRIFTIIYILTGLGVLVALLSALAQQYIRLTTEHSHGHSHERLSRRRQHDQPADEGESR